MAIMAGNVYSNYPLAKDMAEERMDELEQDVFICKVNYHSGNEFVLRTKDEMMRDGDFLYHQMLPFKHKFTFRDNALREAKKFAKKLKKRVLIDRVTYTEKGYEKISHHILCLT